MPRQAPRARWIARVKNKIQTLLIRAHPGDPGVDGKQVSPHSLVPTSPAALSTFHSLRDAIFKKAETLIDQINKFARKRYESF